MIIAYLVATTSFAALCSLCWMILGGGWLGALGVYLVVGQATMLSLIAMSALRASRAAKRTTL